MLMVMKLEMELLTIQEKFFSERKQEQDRKIITILA